MSKFDPPGKIWPSLEKSLIFTLFKSETNSIYGSRFSALQVNVTYDPFRCIAEIYICHFLWEHFIQRARSKTTQPICTKYSRIVDSDVALM